jgi:zinc transporter ZupT
MTHTRKDIIGLVITGILLSFAVFAILYWLFKVEFSESINWALLSGIGGAISEILGAWLQKTWYKIRGVNKTKR